MKKWYATGIMKDDIFIVKKKSKSLKDARLDNKELKAKYPKRKILTLPLTLPFKVVWGLYNRTMEL